MRARYLFLVLVLVLFSGSVSSSEKAFANSSGPPSSMVNGMVNAVTGAFVESSTDLVIGGNHPLVLSRSYSSGSQKDTEGLLSRSWRFNHHPFSRLTVDKSNRRSRWDDLYVPCFRGVEAHFTCVRNSTAPEVPFHLNCKSVPHASGGYPSAQVNLMNSYGYISRATREMHLWHGNGERQLWVPYSSGHRLKQIESPNGRCVNYSYAYYGENAVCLSQIQDDSNSVTFELWGGLSVPKRTLVATGSNGEKVYYRTKIFKAPYFFNNSEAELLYEVTGNCTPTTKYDYDMHENWGAKLTRRTQPGGRFTKISYYKWGRDQVGDVRCHIKKYDFSLNRVSKIEEPAGCDGTPIITHRFFYAEKRTKVFDAYGHPTYYLYDGDGRVTQIKRYLDGIYSQELYRWGEGENSGRLLSRSQCGATELPLRTVHYTYDERGNAVVETHSGDLSGGGSLDQAYSIYRSYSDDGFNLRLSQIEDNGREIRCEYYPRTSLLKAELTLADGKVALRRFFRYDHLANCIECIDDDGSSEDAGDLSNVTCRTVERFAYDSNGYKTQGRRSYVDLSSGQEHQLSRESFEHDQRGLMLWQESFDANDTLQYRVDYGYDAHKHLVMKKDSRGLIEEYAYDGMNHLISQKTPTHHRSRQYDRMNRVVIDQTSQDQCTRTQYDYMGRPLWVTDQNSCATQRVFDPLGRCIEELGPWTQDQQRPVLQFEYDEFGNRTLERDPLGATTRKSYNARDQVCRTVFPDGSTESRSYNLDGTLAVHHLVNGTSQVFEYDGLGQTTKETLLDRDGRVQRFRKMFYKGKRLVEERDSCGLLKVYTYDDAGRLVQETEGERVTRYGYDTLGRKTHTITGAGVTVKEFDSLGQVIEERTEDLQGAVLTQVNYAYDLNGNRTHVTHYHDAGIETTETEYNRLGEPIRICDAQGNETHIAYDRDVLDTKKQRVLRVSSVDPLGRATVKLHDAYGKCVLEEVKDWAGELLSRVEHRYDLCGRVQETVHSVIGNGKDLGSYTSSNTYDLNGRVVELCREGRKTCYSYDRYGQLVSKTLPDGVILYHSYDACSRLSRLRSSDRSIDYSYEYDAYDRPISVEDSVHWLHSSKGYNLAGNLTEERLANALTLEHGYDAYGRKTLTELPDGSSVAYVWQEGGLGAVRRINPQGALLYEHRYGSRALDGSVRECQLPGGAGSLHLERDDQGRLLSIDSSCFVEQLHGYDSAGRLIGSSTRDSRGSFERELEYNDLDQMLAESGTVTHEFTLDSLHNIRSKDDEEYTINAQNQLESLDREYDGRGNLLRVDGTHLSYDALDRLLSMKCGDERQSFRYDSDNRRISSHHYRFQDGQWVEVDYKRYLYAGQNEIGSVDAKGVTREFRCLGVGIGAEIGATVAMELGDEIYVPISNHRGDICAVLNLEGDEVETYRYSSYGEELDLPDNPISPWRYASKRVESNGWVFFGRRYYAPEDGRWVTPDPSGESDGPNLYAYLSSSPLSGVDHYGLWRVRFESITKFCSSFIEFLDDQPDLCFSVGYNHAINHRTGSATYEIKGKHLENTPYVTTVTNGVGTGLQAAYNMAQSISLQFGGASVYHTHNQTYTLLGDLIAWTLRPLVGGAAVTEKVMAWREIIRSFGGVDKPGMIFEHAHSEGARVVAEALKRMTAEEREKIWVCTYGAAQIIPKSAAFRVINYVDVRDPVPYIANPYIMGCLLLGLPTPEYEIRIVGGALPKLSEPLKTLRSFSIEKHYFQGDEYQRCVRMAKNQIDCFLGCW